MPRALHLNLDDAWPADGSGFATIDARKWGPQLRFSSPSALIERFYREIEPQLAAFLLYGSGDFHHLSALWIRRVPEPAIVVSFDNHPDWDVRPPRWGCGGWVNRALELPQVKKVCVWGCGNFEPWWPAQFFGNRRAEREGELDLHAWADDRSAGKQHRRGAILRSNWREAFENFTRGIAGENIYVTIDLDCLRSEEAVTNWENGKFTTDDVTWALARLRERACVIGGDICGAHSKPKYARWKQRFVSEFDHPKLELPSEKQIAEINHAALQKLWPLLADGPLA